MAERSLVAARDPIAAMASQLKLHYPSEGVRSWNTGIPVCRISLSTGVTSVVPPDEVPAHSTGMLVRSGVYDVNRFCWGTRNLWGVVVYMNDDDIYYNEPDTVLLGRLLDTSYDGTRIFGSDVSHHAF